MRGSLWRRIPENAALTWRWFRYWRRRYVWLRLIILVLIFAQPVYGVFRPIIRDLVVIAIKGIETAKKGPRLYARAYEFEEKKQLQHALRARFDADGDGLLTEAEAGRLTDATGLAGNEVTGSGLEVELGPLVEGSHKAGLLSRVVSATDIRRRVLERALAKREAEHRALWEEVGPMLEVEYARPADYLRWETWERGLAAFLDVLRYCVPFASRLIPGPHRFEPEYPRQPWRSAWQGVGDAVTMLALLVAIIVSIRRHGKGRELERRFLSEPSLGAAPCPICAHPTNDFGALGQHRASRAWAIGAVAFLAVATMGILVSERAPFEFLGSWPARATTWLAFAFYGGIAVGILRWALWPREVHACHRWPLLRVLGLVAAAIIVFALVSQIALFGMRTFERHRQTITSAVPRQRPTPPVGRGPAARGEPARAGPQRRSAPAAGRGGRAGRGATRGSVRVGRPERSGRRTPRGGPRGGAR